MEALGAAVVVLLALVLEFELVLLGLLEVSVILEDVLG